MILVVDDEEQILKLFQRAMRPRHDVILERFGQRAIDRLLSAQEIDITFLDLMMPDVTGAEILRQVRKDAPARLERIVISTGALAIPGIEEMLESYRVPTSGEALPLLEKPYGIEALERMIRRFTAIASPRGPHYPRVRPVSRPELPEDTGEEEITAVTRLAQQHDPIAARVLEQRLASAEHARMLSNQQERVEALEEHFRDELVDGKQVRGMAAQTYHDVSFVKTMMKVILAGLPILALLLTGAWWMMQQAQPKPERIDYDRIVREVSRQSSEPKK